MMLNQQTLFLIALILVQCVTSQAWRVCFTKECFEASERVQQYLNESANPCDDFYLYACGRFTQVHPHQGHDFDASFVQARELDEKMHTLLDKERIKYHESKAVRAVKNFYDDCRKKDTHNECYTLVSYRYFYVLVRLYLDKYFDENQLKSARLMTNLIHNNLYKTQFPFLDWEATSHVRKKLQSLEKNIGYPAWIVNNTELDYEYEDDFNRYGKSPEKGRKRVKQHDPWTMGVMETNAHFDPFGGDEITFPAGNFYGKFDSRLSAAMNFGSAGFLAGHEWTHAVDQFIRTSKSKKSIERYEE